MKTLVRTLLPFASMLLMFCAAAYGDKRLPTHEETLEGAGIAITPEAMIAALANEDGMVRQSAAALLGERRVYAAVPALIKVLDDDDFVYARIAAAGALLRLGNTAGEPVLALALSENEAHVAVAAAQEFAAAGDLRGLEPLIARLPAAKEPLDRLALVRGIAGFHRFTEGKPEIRTALIGVLQNDASSIVRMAAAEELSTLSGDDVRAALAAAAERDPDPGVRAIARTQLERRLGRR
jgi:HEAT repeat protein